MNILSFRLFSCYSSGIFALIVIILTLIYTIVFDGISPLITTLFSSGITLPISYNSNNNYYNDPPIALDIKPSAYNLGGYNFGTYNLPI